MWLFSETFIALTYLFFVCLPGKICWANFLWWILSFLTSWKTLRRSPRLLLSIQKMLMRRMPQVWAYFFLQVAVAHMATSLWWKNLDWCSNLLDMMPIVFYSNPCQNKTYCIGLAGVILIILHFFSLYMRVSWVVTQLRPGLSNLGPKPEPHLPAAVSLSFLLLASTEAWKECLNLERICSVSHTFDIVF